MTRLISLLRLKRDEKTEDVKFYRDTMKRGRKLQPDGWHLTIVHHHMRPGSSMYEEEQMVEACHPSFYSLQSVSQTIHREDEEDVSLCYPRENEPYEQC